MRQTYDTQDILDAIRQFRADNDEDPTILDLAGIFDVPYAELFRPLYTLIKVGALERTIIKDELARFRVKY
jgi:hypothetical protein